MRVKRSVNALGDVFHKGWVTANKSNQNLAKLAIEHYGEPQTDLEIELYNIIDY